MSKPEPWIFEAEELPRWARGGLNDALRSSVQPADPCHFPAKTRRSPGTLLAQLFALRVLVAAGFVALAWGGFVLFHSHQLFGALVVAFLLGAAWGAMSLAYAVIRHWEDAQIRQSGFQVYPIVADLALSTLLGPAILLPLLVFAAWTVYLLFDDRLVGLSALVPATLLAVWRLGSGPVTFADDFLRLPSRWIRDSAKPAKATCGRSLRSLAAILLVASVVPVATSNAVGLLAVVLVVAAFLFRHSVRLLRVGSPRIVCGAILARGECVLRDYLDYAPSHRLHWTPTLDRNQRRKRFLILMGLVDLTLLVGLGYYCPWEPFAAATIAHFETGPLFRPEYAMNDFRWLLAPIMLAQQADPLPVYLANFVVAVLAFAGLAPLVLLAAYLPNLIELESLAQALKRDQRAN